MSKALLIMAVMILALGATTTGRSDQVYKWVDAQGNVHYTDHPHPGAQKVLLPKTQTYQPPSMEGAGNTAASQPSPPPVAGASTTAYKQFSISSPADKATLWYVDQVPVSVDLSPALHNGDTLTFHLDEKSIGPTTQTMVTFKDVPRGEHSVSVTLNSANGASQTAGPVTFFVRQKTIISPKPPH
ncbi:MAG: DUF4124 domain-containing protein [Gammaproteobacteria bacterium]|nr:DUF4124 domain-containing protein [Gammaproteobacteria bacterium]MDE2346279.1 DUF4124 domain-containing protein [Gammaproteobacteria bacterium]